MKIYLYFKTFNPRLLNIIKKFNLQHDENSTIGLMINNNSLGIYDRQKPNQSAVMVNFTSKKNYYRCYNQNVKKEILYKVAGIKKNYFPVVLDGTAGLGKDAFILSFLGCTVYMIERNPVIAALLQDGLERAYENEKIGSWIKKRLHLIYDNSVQMLNLSIIKPDVIYLDPMYPDKKKSLPKKDMQIFQKFIGRDSDLNKLLKKSRQLAKKRVIVKRPYHALPLSNATVNFVIYTKQHRFDIYHPF